jgi:hypothetical protein
MSESYYRLCKLAILTIFAAGSLFIGWQFSQNGRYLQFDRQKDSLVIGTTAQGGPTQFIDTRTGIVCAPKKE